MRRWQGGNGMRLTGPYRRTELLVFGAPDLREAEIAEVVDVLRSGWIGTGPRVARFERNFAAYKGVPQALALNSCTAALQLALSDLCLEAGDEVITTPLTFCATVNAIVHACGTPVLADIDRRTMNIDPSAVANRVGPRTRAIVAVHFAGRCCTMPALVDIARRQNLEIIEDCAHAIETTLENRHAGTWGRFGCFSFYATKNVTTAEGGMLITNDPDRLQRLRVRSLHGITRDAWKRHSAERFRHYAVVDVGFKFSMTDLAAAIGVHQLSRIEENWRRRKA